MTRSAEPGIDSDFSEVSLLEGVSFSLEFLNLNPNGTIPTLTGGKSYKSTAEVIDCRVSIPSTKIIKNIMPTQFSTAKPPMTQSRATSPRALPSRTASKSLETLPLAITESYVIGGGWLPCWCLAGADRIHFGSAEIEEGVSALEKRFGPLPEKVKPCWAMAMWVERTEGLPRLRDVHPRYLGPRRTRGTPKTWPRDAHYEQSDLRQCSTCCAVLALHIRSLALCIAMSEVLPTVQLRLEGGTHHQILSH
ncbi:hypothetical protein V8E52_004423 [Russula decolorans]